MVNYYDDDSMRESYIVNYKIKKNELVLIHVDGKKYSIPYSKTAEETVLSKMEKQVSSFEKHIDRFEYDKSKTALSGALILLASVLSIPIMNNIVIPLVGITISQVFFAISMYINKELNEYRKDVFVLKNKILLNKNIDNIQVKSKLKDKTQEKLESIDTININNVSKFTIQELYDLRDAINRCKKQQTFEGTEILNKGRQYTL